MLFLAYYYCIFALILSLSLEKKFDKLEILGLKGGAWMRQNSDLQVVTSITWGEISNATRGKINTEAIIHVIKWLLTLLKGSHLCFPDRGTLYAGGT